MFRNWLLEKYSSKAVLKLNGVHICRCKIWSLNPGGGTLFILPLIYVSTPHSLLICVKREEEIELDNQSHKIII